MPKERASYAMEKRIHLPLSGPWMQVWVIWFVCHDCIVVSNLPCTFLWINPCVAVLRWWHYSFHLWWNQSQECQLRSSVLLRFGWCCRCLRCQSWTLVWRCEKMIVMSLHFTYEHTLAVAFGIGDHMAWFTRCQSILESGMVIVVVVRCCSETCPQIRRTERKCVFDSRSSRSSDSPFSCRFSLLILRFPSFSYCST